jgi:hypothetical protein
MGGFLSNLIHRPQLYFSASFRSLKHRNKNRAAACLMVDAFDHRTSKNT